MVSIVSVFAGEKKIKHNIKHPYIVNFMLYFLDCASHSITVFRIEKIGNITNPYKPL